MTTRMGSDDPKDGDTFTDYVCDNQGKIIGEKVYVYRDRIQDWLLVEDDTA